MCFGTGVTRFCCRPCSKSNLQNCQYVVGFYSAAYATLLCWSIYDLTFEESNTSILSRFHDVLIAVSIISLIVSTVLLYGIIKKIEWILVLWFLVALLNIVFWTIGFLVILPISIGYSALFILIIWVYFIYASVIVNRGREEIQNESF